MRILAVTTAVLFISACAQAPKQQAAEVSDAPLRGKLAKEAYAGPYWLDRATYPTGHFSPSWLADAGEAAAKINRGLPDGANAARAKRGGSLNPNVFTPLGPRPLGTGGGIAGRTNVVIGHPTNASIAWLGSDGGGVWKTTNCCDANTTWRNTTDISANTEVIQNSAIGDLTLDPNNPNVLYAGTGDLRFGSFSFGSNGVLKSIDGGETWAVKGADVFNPFYPPNANLPPQYQAIGKVVVDPNNSNNVIVGAKTGVYISYDAGDNWTGPCLTNSFSTQRQDITGLVASNVNGVTRLVAAVGTRAFATTVQTGLDRNGANGLYRAGMPNVGCPVWTTISTSANGWPAGTATGTTPGPLGRIDIAVAPSNPNVIYAQVAVPNNTATILGVWKTTDGGDTWTQATAGNIAGAGTQSWYNAGMAIDPTNPDNVFLSAFRTFRSTTGGSNFVATGTFPHVDHHALGFVANDPNRLLIGTDGGVYYSSNALAATPSWVALNATLNTIEFYSGGISPNFNSAANVSAVGGAQDNSCMVSTWPAASIGAQSWAVRNGGDGFWSAIEPILQQRWYYSSQNGAIVATSTASGGLGGTSAVSAAPSGWTSDRKSFVTNFDLYQHGGETTGCPAATGCGRIIAGSFRVWESVTGGVPNTSWKSNSPDLTKGTLADRSFINQVSYAVSTPTIAMAGTNDGNVWFGFNMGQDIADSATWVNVTDGNTVLPNRFVLDVATDPVDPLTGYAVMAGFDQNTPSTPGHVFQVKCTANCASFAWRNVSGNLPNIPVNSVIVNPKRPKQVFAGSDWGLYYTDDVDANPVVWNKHTGLPNVMIWDMTMDRGFTTLAVWTRSRGAWVWPFPDAIDPMQIFANGFE
jgi:hypothetical protein